LRILIHVLGGLRDSSKACGLSKPKTAVAIGVLGETLQAELLDATREDAEREIARLEEVNIAFKWGF
jgi:hypothetical protein